MSKQKMQVVNEELKTPKFEPKNHLDEIGAAHEDLLLLIASTDIATFLPSDLRIKRYPQGVLEIFNLTPSHPGRELAVIAHNLSDDGPLQDATRTVATLQKVDLGSGSRDHRFYLAQVNPSRTAANCMGGDYPDLR